jgi:hypothetical protein
MTSLTSFSQQASIPLNRLWNLECERIALRNDSNEIHLGEKPLLLKNTIGSADFQWIESNRNFKKIGAKFYWLLFFDLLL